ncbi:efflux RND transporter periplasmic adaptor subunit [Methylosinus sporium]|uniref:Diguanylate phosphodiesterase n=1 Tax=Methylosinus sporium TaxID=428 RepID=A0A2U1SLZ2_METSR|nr:efflux RND transporter periplasmic adaptor subunit [Methylosinus sporium]PWB92638.1 diguanylate phosphodiesterase [Methylosinus sporium]
MRASTEGASALRPPERTKILDEDRVAVLEQALWKRLDDAADLRALLAAWLALQCGIISFASCGAIALRENSGEPSAASWPEGVDALARLHSTLDFAVEQRRGVAQKPSAEPGVPSPPAQIAYPIIVDEKVLGAAAIEIHGDGGAQLRLAARQLQWGVAWIRERLRKDAAADATHRLRRAAGVLDMLAVALEGEGFASAARACVTELASLQSCERVSVGFAQDQGARVAAISHSAHFGKDLNLVRLLNGVMNEAVDQRAVIAYPPHPDGSHVVRAHGELAEAHGCGAILTTPMFAKDEFIGAMTFERGKDRPFEADEIEFLECLATTLGPVLDIRRREDRWLIAKAWERLRDHARALFGSGHAGRKLVAFALVATTLALYVVTDVYRVTANAVIEGKVQRVIVAPFNGFIRDAHVRAGDAVRSGDTLATLDDREFALERLRWATERQKKQYEFERAGGARNRADTRILAAEMQESEAQIRLADEQLARTRLQAPFDGLVVSGDLSQSIGAAVQRGQALFEIAPLDDWRVVLDVDETQVDEMAVGLAGELLIAALPNETFPLVVEKITPVAKADEGVNTFRVEAALRGNSPKLRPGMKGVGKVEVGRRRIAWIWTRSLIEWFTIWSWRWLS